MPMPAGSTVWCETASARMLAQVGKSAAGRLREMCCLPFKSHTLATYGGRNFKLCVSEETGRKRISSHEHGTI